MKVATYNVNGINGRLPVLLRWLKKAKPDHSIELRFRHGGKALGAGAEFLINPGSHSKFEEPD